MIRIFQNKNKHSKAKRVSNIKRKTRTNSILYNQTQNGDASHINIRSEKKNSTLNSSLVRDNNSQVDKQAVFESKEMTRLVGKKTEDDTIGR